MKHFLYLIGVPGAGKSTAMGLAVTGIMAVKATAPFEAWEFPGGVWLGALDRGTDALSMSVQPLAVEWLELSAPPAVVAEGDRLANVKFFQAVRDLGYQLEVVYLNTPAQTAAARRDRRGTDQNPTWLEGRRTKVQRLAAWANLTIDGDLPAASVAEILQQRPAFQVLRGEPVDADAPVQDAGQGRMAL